MGADQIKKGPDTFFLPDLVFKGRVEFLMQFPSLSDSEARKLIPDPADPATFERCKLDFRERARHAETYALYRDLLALRRSDPAFRAQRLRGVDGAVLSEHAFVLRYFVAPHDDRLLLVNLGRDLRLVPAPEPLLAPPAGKRWRVAWSSEGPAYGGCGTPPIETEDGGWHIPGESAVVAVSAAVTDNR